LAALCPHGICYGIKSLLRAESVRDHIDMIMSLRYQPTVIMNDLSNLTARHGNRRNADMFSHNDGRLDEATEDVLRQIVQRTYSKSLPFLTTGQYSVHQDVLDHPYESSDKSMHPVSRTSLHYCLSDEFHKSNMSGSSEKLRDKSLVPELHGINTQVAEQMFSQVTKNAYFLNAMKPAVHLLMLRLTVHLQNEKRNHENISSMKKASRGRRDCIPTVVYGQDGRMSFIPATAGK